MTKSNWRISFAILLLLSCQKVFESPLDKVRIAAFRHECSDPRPYDPRSTDRPPEAVFHPLPELPSNIPLMGNVILEAVVLPDGSACDARVIRGYGGDPQIDSACRDAVKRWRSRPAVRSGIAVYAYETVTIALEKVQGFDRIFAPRDEM